MLVCVCIRCLSCSCSRVSFHVCHMFCGVCSEIDDGKDLPRELLEYLYNSMVSSEIKMLHSAPPAGAGDKGAYTALRSYRRNRHRHRSVSIVLAVVVSTPPATPSIIHVLPAHMSCQVTPRALPCLRWSPTPRSSLR
jgi:hypothetical protein